MATFFSNRRGTVVRVPGPALPFQILLSGASIGTTDARAIYNQVSISEQGSMQISPTVGDSIYAYIFGDKPGTVRLSGTCFTEMCDSSGNRQPSGMKQVADTYRRLRASASPTLAQLSVGELDYRGLIESMTLELSDSDLLLGQWAIVMRTLPGNQP